MAAAIAEGAVPRRSCAACTEEQRQEFGCAQDTERREHWIEIDGIDGVIKRCPYAVAGPREMRVVQFANLIECGVLPDVGGWLDQAACYVEAATVVLAARQEFARTKGSHHDRR